MTKFAAPSPPHAPRQRRRHYAWVVVVVTFCTLIVAAGVRSTPGVLIVPLEHEFGWSRATISLAVSVNLLLYGLIGPFAAALYDAIGLRRTMAIALTLLAAGVSLTTLVTAPWQMVLLWGVTLGVTYRTCRRFLTPDWAALLTVIAAVACSDRFTPRPDIVIEPHGYSRRCAR